MFLKTDFFSLKFPKPTYLRPLQKQQFKANPDTSERIRNAVSCKLVCCAEGEGGVRGLLLSSEYTSAATMRFSLAD